MPNNYSLKLVRSLSFNPWYNLAVEEELFRNIKSDQVILYLWQNENTVVIGRNQNPWRECRCKILEEHGGKLARRLSGGGAVYHDLGNLNFTFVAKEGAFNIKKQLEVIIEAVKLKGIDAEFSGRNDIVAQGKKFSGNAFYYDDDNCYHHGTLLVASDMKKIQQYLQVSKEKIKSKGVNSVESRVVNLNTINPGLDINNLSAALEQSFQQVYHGTISETKVIDEDMGSVKKLYEKYSSWNWRYGESPKFEMTLYHRFKWGDLDINFNLKDGHISKVTVFSDAIDCKLIKDIEEVLLGIEFSKKAILMNLENLKNRYDKNLIDEIKNWIDEKEI
ncbi:lipoate--protein ligase [Dehalobacterium formicoaceticum]|uniref:lipoate--protein ligase n=1 Tax=Dehalobacterium formicoaceticum TaxID=51515 RepID=A0ABT1Y7S2_9FIRM|nr:lipoate--protein ligase [Dehalobacterium formicoaceticum]MCR6546541.1 lipoate--protein ligase [Dehalobacterium formicoaceticum]